MGVSNTGFDFLRATQNLDGGWGYFPGKRSWLEPTLYAAVALQGEPAAGRALKLIRSWALPEGGWRTSADVAESNWTSALCLNFYFSHGIDDAAFHRGLHLLLRTLGSEGNALYRLAQVFWLSLDMDIRHTGWPWRSGCASWVEPTAHAAMTLRRLLPGLPAREAAIARERLRMAEVMLCDRQCVDGGWNYGNRIVLGQKLPSYPETTGIALVGLQSLQWARRAEAEQRVRSYLETRLSPLAAAWLSLGMRVNGLSADPPVLGANGARNDIVLHALFAAAESQDRWRFFEGPKP